MASPTQWTWVWVNSGSWWWTGKPGVLQSMGSQRVGHDWATELNWTEICHSFSSKEQVSFNPMAAVIICSDFVVQVNKVCHCFHFFPIYFPCSDGTGCHDFRFLNVEFFSFIFISWRLITLQYCSGFCHKLTRISHGFTCAPHPDPPSHLPLHPIPFGLPSGPALSTCLMHPSWAGDLFHLW